MTSANAAVEAVGPRRSATPQGMIPEVRDPGFELPEDLPRYWWNDCPASTLMLAALSSGFPPGERFFIDSVRHYRDRITDPELREAVQAFIGQEAHHSKEHRQLNEFLEARGIRVDRLERDVKWLMDWMRSNLSPERQLAHTVAVEHFTALMAEAFLLRYDTLEEMDPRIAPLWAWHAIEESEHKAVAFDVYKSVGGSEFVRVTQMLVVSVLFPVFTTLHTAQLMKEDGQLANLRSWARLGYYLWGQPGVFRKLLPEYLRYYSPRFHPWHQDARGLVEKAKRKWLNF